VTPDVDARLAELAARWELPPDAPARFRALLEMVAAEPSSITTVRDPAAAVDRHVADSLSGLLVPALRAAGTIADLGSGGGFPGLALGIARPDATVTLVESVGRKCDFLRRAAEAIGAANVAVVHGRAEDWRDGLGTQDVVTARALAPLNVLAEYAAPLLRDGGALVAWKGRAAAEEVRDGSAAAVAVGLQPAAKVAVADVPGADARALYVYSKVRATPPGFPRRAGMARKRPLRA
jgi:16S rRNA (guanine527-N7)-methyltransferase